MSAAELELQYEDFEKQTHASRLGMWVFVASELMIFAGLFGLYAALRAAYAHDFALAAQRSKVAIGTTNTAILLTSSLLVALAVHAVREGRAKRASDLLLGAAVMGVGFLVLKFIEYGEHFREGIRPGVSGRTDALALFGERSFFNLYYVMTGFHALHVIAGVTILTVLAIRARQGAYGPRDEEHVPLELGGIYWHFVDVVWLFLWPMFYLLK